MKYDQHILENAYQKIYLNEADENLSSTISDRDLIAGNPGFRGYNPTNDFNDPEGDREEEEDKWSELLRGLEDARPSHKTLENLNGLSESDIEDLTSYLNTNEQWSLKDKLIKALFVLKGYEFKNNSLG